MNKALAAFAFVGIFVYVQFASAAMSSTNYQIRWDTVSTGGSDSASSATYLLRDTVSGAADASGSSASYQIDDGYRAGLIDQIISFDLYIQNSASGVQATNFSGTTITVSSTTGFTVGNYVALVQDRGSSPVVAVGKILSIGAGTIVIDRLSHGGISPVIDGSGDYLYPLTGSSLALLGVDGSTIATGVISFEMTIDNDSGYVIQILEDGNLRTGSEEINDVVDGTVSAGSEEFGVRSSDTTLLNSAFDTSDAAITTSAQEIVTQSTYVIDDRSFTVFKLGAQASTSSGTYANTVSFIASGNF